ncbi:hypothetical protein DFH09DRAFT_1313659 [Mycena vulgaris]|nr:hypothetical protein DFH09DRAFT_1313659 [Mycena vulgaris]
MSLFIQGLPIQSVIFAPIPRTFLSGSLGSRLPTPRDSAYLFTSTAGTCGPFSFPLVLTTSPSATTGRPPLEIAFFIAICVCLGPSTHEHFSHYHRHLRPRFYVGFNSQAPFVPVMPAPSPAVDRSYDLTSGLPGVYSPNPTLPSANAAPNSVSSPSQAALWHFERLPTSPLPLRSILSISETPSINLMHPKLKLKLILILILVVRPIADIRPGDVVMIKCALYRRDGFEHGQTAKVYGVLAGSIKKLSSLS